MPYITTRQPPKYKQISFDDLISGEIDVSKLLINSDSSNTRTIFVNEINDKFLANFDFNAMLYKLILFNEKYKHLRSCDRKTLYYSFHIPKRSGGLRQIDAPEKELKEALYDLKRIFEDDFLALYHTSAFAYVKKRSAVDAVKKHQKNNSKWFAKLDFSNFFGSTTLNFVYDMLSRIFPFSEVVKLKDGEKELRDALDLCFLNGVLPQGTPISPMLTNIMMIPIDHKICNDLKKEPNTFVYTRFSDDIQISSKRDFNCDKLVDYIIKILIQFNAPFSINRKKTRYGSSAGRNWNLGVMLNKDNEITIGHQKKKCFKAMVNNYICDKQKKIDWDLHDVQTFQGLISYYNMIEPEAIKFIIEQYNQKYGVDVRSMIKADLAA